MNRARANLSLEKLKHIRALEREAYRRRQAASGKSVKSVRAPGMLTPEVKHAEMLETCRRYRNRHLERRRKSARDWAKRNRSASRKRFKERYYSDPKFHFGIKYRRRIHMAIRNQSGKKAFKSMELLGCDIQTARSYIEAQFTRGMSWELVHSGKIHIDHKMPCSVFDLTNPIHQKVCFHYTNLQPLWAVDNLTKHDKILNPQLSLPV